MLGYRTRLYRTFLAAFENAGEPDAERKADTLTAGQVGVFLTTRLDPDLAASTLDSVVAELRG